MSSLTRENLERLKTLAYEVSEREGCRLYDLVFIPGPRILRVYIDKPKGVSVDDCANVSRGLNLLLDVEDIIPGGAYELEVSSPGLERRLNEVWHYQESLGQRLRLKLHKALDRGEKLAPLKVVEGYLLEVKDTRVQVKMGESVLEVEIENIERAQVVFEPPQKSQPKKKR